MSHVTTIDIQVKDLECLKTACTNLGLEFREGQKSYKWYGRHVGDYPLPEGFTHKDLGKCDHAIGVPGNSRAYEIGVVKKGDSYTMLWDFWQGGFGLQEKVGDGCGELVDQYAQEVAMKEASEFAQAQGWSISKEFDEETSETVIKLRKY